MTHTVVGMRHRVLHLTLTLSMSLITYQDTHYLLYIYDRLRMELVAHPSNHALLRLTHDATCRRVEGV